MRVKTNIKAGQLGVNRCETFDDATEGRRIRRPIVA